MTERPPHHPGEGAPDAFSDLPEDALAGYGPRLGGWLIDFVIVTVIWLVVAASFHLIHEVHVLVRGMHTFRYHVAPAGVLIDAAIAVVYGGLLTGLPRGQTIGMMAARTRVVGTDADEPLGYPRAFARAAAEYLMALVFFLPWVVDVLFPLWDPDKQTLHDKITNALVITV